MHARVLLAVAASATCVSVVSTIGAQIDPALRLFAQMTPSIGRVYAPPPPAGAASGSRLFFVGEPMTLEMDIVNEAGVHAVLLPDDPARGVTVRLRRQDQEGQRWFGGPIVPVSLRYDDRPSRVYQGVPQPQQLDQRMPLAPGEAIRWSADVDLQAIEPGLYVFELTPAVAEESGIRVIAHVGALPFELRARTPDATREIMLRHGWRAVLQQDYLEAQRRFQDLLAAFPESAVAARSLGHVYEMLGRNSEARQMFERTREVLRTGADVALTANHEEEYRGEALARELQQLDEQIERLPR